MSERQNASVKLCGVANIEELTYTVQELVRTILPECNEVAVYLKELSSDKLVCLHQSCSRLPTVGIAQNAYLSRKVQFHSTVDRSDPVFSILHLENNRIKKVLTTPICSQESGELIAILLAQCASYTRNEQKILDFLQKQVSACYGRIARTSSSSTNTSINNSDILQLCADLNDREATLIQMKLIHYIQTQTCATCAFLMLVEPDSWELSIQVIGDKVLNEEIRFSTNDGNFSVFHQGQKALTLTDLPSECRQELEHILNLKMSSFLSIPVLSKSCGQAIAFMCTVNKINANSFSLEDVAAIERCFLYTVTVLASSLAVVNERRLKNETQSLLQVARNLFTHLGECIFYANSLYNAFIRKAPQFGSAKRSIIETRLNEYHILDADGASYVHPLITPFNRQCSRLNPNLDNYRKIRIVGAESHRRAERKGLRSPMLSDVDGNSSSNADILAELFNTMVSTDESKVFTSVLDAFIPDLYTEVLVPIKWSRRMNMHSALRSKFEARRNALFTDADYNMFNLPMNPFCDRSTGGETYHTFTSDKCAVLYWNNDLTTLLREIMQEARNLTQSERCSVFLIDEETDELVAKVFDGVEKKTQEQTEIRMPLTQGIAGHVATTGVLLNIKDAYSHPLFYRGIDQNTGFRTRNILCFPIKDENGKVIGVAQLCNKKTCSHFTHFDEEIASAFSVYCCISIIHSLMYKKVIDAQQRNTLANELMMYHMKSLMYKRLQDSHNRNTIFIELMLYYMKVSPEDLNSLCVQPVPTPLEIAPNFEKFLFAPRDIDDSQIPVTIMSMCEELGFLSRWRIRKETLAAFILMARKGYRSPPYHNWMHAFSVAHFSYLLIKNLQLQNHLDDIELFALFISCICHDIDHRGTNNSFQLTSKSVLAQLYSSEGSVMERHHLAQSMCILNTEGCNIFENLNNKDYQRVLDLMKDIILATDIAHHLRIMKDVESMAKAGYDVSNAKHHKLLLCILMTSSDLSDQTKNWKNTSDVATLIYREFFSQGDLEKELGYSPVEMMDRERAQIPALQISFLDHIAQPAFKVLSKLFPVTDCLVATIHSHRQRWERINNCISEQNIDTRMTMSEMLALCDE